MKIQEKEAKARREKARVAARNKRARLQEQAVTGEIRPRYWKTCAHCGSIYPFYNFYLQHTEAVTCPKWLTGKDCGSKYRVQNMMTATASGEREKPYRPKKNDCRKELCNAWPPCINISSCLDKEIANPGTLPLKPDGSCKRTK